MKADAPVPDKIVIELCKTENSRYTSYTIKMDKLQVRIYVHIEDLKDSVDKHYKEVIHFLREEKGTKISRDNDLFNH